MADKIQVAVRVRPVLFQKKDVEVHWGCEQGMVVQLDPTTKKRIGHPYLFDQVFSTETQNFQIFNQVVQPLINSAMDGFNVTFLVKTGDLFLYSMSKCFPFGKSLNNSASFCFEFPGA